MFDPKCSDYLEYVLNLAFTLNSHCLSSSLLHHLDIHIRYAIITIFSLKVDVSFTDAFWEVTG